MFLTIGLDFAIRPPLSYFFSEKFGIQKEKSRAVKEQDGLNMLLMYPLTFSAGHLYVAALCLTSVYKRRH